MFLKETNLNPQDYETVIQSDTKKPLMRKFQFYDFDWISLFELNHQNQHQDIELFFKLGDKNVISEGVIVGVKFTSKPWIYLEKIKFRIYLHEEKSKTAWLNRNDVFGYRFV